MGFLMLPHQIKKYHEDEPRFNNVYSRNNLLKNIKDRA